MTKQTRKLKLSKETLRRLDAEQLKAVAGGSFATCGPTCYQCPTDVIRCETNGCYTDTCEPNTLCWC